MSQYEKFKFENWGDGDYTERLYQLFTLITGDNKNLLCVLDTEKSINFRHFISPLTNETVIYQENVNGIQRNKVGYFLLLNSTHEFLVKTSKLYERKFYQN